jgi:hypothetical protein
MEASTGLTVYLSTPVFISIWQGWLANYHKAGCLLSRPTLVTMVQGFFFLLFQNQRSVVVSSYDLVKLKSTG